MKKFLLVSEYLGYINKKDITNVDPRYLVSPSQNVVINDGEKITIRKGYTLDGVANAALTPIISNYDWNTSTNTEQNLRSYQGELEYRYVDSLGAVTWRRLANGFGSSVMFNFAEYWDTTEAQDLLLIVNGDHNIRMWSGGVTTYASSTVNTITKQGSTTWAEERFLVAGTRQVIIGGITYTYTGGESTTTLTGVTPDPTAGGHVAGNVAHQALRVTANTPSANFDNDIIAVLNNQAYIGDLNRRDVYVSKSTDYTSFTFSNPRIPGEGALLTLDSPPSAFAVQEDAMYIFGNQDQVYQTLFTLSADLTKEALNIKRLKSGPGQGAVSQSSVANIKNSVLFLNREKAVDTLGRIEQINTPQSLPISDPVKSEFLDATYTVNPHIKYFKNKTYVALPSDSKVMIFDHERGFWYPPQILPIRRLAIIGGELYGHSNAVPETYKLFTGTSDNTNPINAIAAFAYRNYGTRSWKKSHDEWYSEGYISSNTTLLLGLKYDFGGFTTILEKEIRGDDDSILFSTISDNSFGKSPFGQLPVGSITDSPSDLSKFRVIHELGKVDYYEVQPFYQSNDDDAQWELIASGGNAMESKTDNVFIKQ